jgi:hypothetical protein
VLQIPGGKPCRSQQSHLRWTDEATVRTHIPDELSGAVRVVVLPPRAASVSPEIRTIASDILVTL